MKFWLCNSLLANSMTLVPFWSRLSQRSIHCVYPYTHDLFHHILFLDSVGLNCFKHWIGCYLEVHKGMDMRIKRRDRRDQNETKVVELAPYIIQWGHFEPPLFQNAQWCQSGIIQISVQEMSGNQEHQKNWRYTVLLGLARLDWTYTDWLQNQNSRLDPGAKYVQSIKA